MIKDRIVFKKWGSQFQIAIDNIQHLAQIVELDDALWAVTNAPISSFACDDYFLRYLDSDGDGFIRSDEVKEAINWLLKVTTSLDGLTAGSQEISLSSIKDSLLLKAAKLVLNNLNLTNSETISLNQVRDRQKFLSNGVCNGDGVIPIKLLKDPKIRQLADAIMQSIGTVTDASGEQGINLSLLNSFSNKAKDCLKWKEAGKIPDDAHHSIILPFANKTSSAFHAYSEVKNKIDEYFCLCDLSKVAPQDFVKCEIPANILDGLVLTDSNAIFEAIQATPISKPTPSAILNLQEDLNPLFIATMERFVDRVISCFQLEDNNHLSVAEWKKLKATFAPYEAWQSTPSTGLENYSEKQLQSFLDDGLIDDLKELIDKDKSVATEIVGIEQVEKLLLYQAELMVFARNYTALSDLFEPNSPSIIQAGRLVMDGRHFDLCVTITDYKKHIPVASKSNICVLYLEISRYEKQRTEVKQVAVAVTSGSITTLYVGRTGVFFTSDSKEWQAKTLAVIANPVSLGEALKMPFVKLKEFSANQMNKFTGTQYKSLEKGISDGLSNAEKSFTTKGKKSNPASGFKELFIGGSIAIAALGSAFAFIVEKFSSVAFTSILAVMLGLFALITVPIIISAILKLRRRNIGMFLQAGGWSLNVPLHLSTHIGMLFTNTPALPKDAIRCHFDITRQLFKSIKKNIVLRCRFDKIILVILISLVVINIILYAMHF